MCGLVTLISKRANNFQGKDLKLFQELLVADTIRGQDATGMFFVSLDGNAYSLKNNVNGYTFSNTPEYKQFLENCFFNGVILSGHNRSKTLGDNTDKNAHPFIANHIICSHNGTLYQHKTLANTETDSEAITIALSQKDPKEVLEDLDGSFALTWYNAKEKTFSIARNDKGIRTIRRTAAKDKKADKLLPTFPLEINFETFLWRG